jgi:hypothetical protein
MTCCSLVRSEVRSRTQVPCRPVVSSFHTLSHELRGEGTTIDVTDGFSPLIPKVYAVLFDLEYNCRLLVTFP